MTCHLREHDLQSTSGLTITDLDAIPFVGDSTTDIAVTREVTPLPVLLSQRRYCWLLMVTSQVVQDTHHLIVEHRKTFYFVKTKEKYPLLITLDNIFPSGWQYLSVEPKLREITYQQIELDGNPSLLYHIEKKTSKCGNSLCIFTVSQQNREIAIQLAVHLKVIDKDPLPTRITDPSIVCLEQFEAPSMATKTITKAGGLLEIPGTGVSLKIPQDALPTDMDQCVIQMRITGSRIVEDQVTSLCSNSSTAVEILPTSVTLQCAATLSLPHCLKFKKKKERTARIFTNIEKGSPSLWEEHQGIDYKLEDDACTIQLKQFCCVKYSIDDTIVKATKITVYTAAKTVKQKDELAEVEVGYFSDIPGRGELLRLNPNFHFDSKRTLLCFKKQNCPLQVSLKKILPKQWTCWVPKENPKEIPFNIIASSIEHSNLYILQKRNDRPGNVICHFTASQNGNPMQMELSLCLYPQQEGQPEGTVQTGQQMTNTDPMAVTFQFLSQKLGSDWRFVGRKLGLEDADLEHIKEDYTGMQEQIYQMLVRWKRKNGTNATHANLIQSLENAQRKDLAEDVKNRKDQEVLAMPGSYSGERT